MNPDRLIIPGDGVLNISIGFSVSEIKTILNYPDSVDDFDDCSYLNYFDLGISFRIKDDFSSSMFLYGENDKDFKPYTGTTSEGITTTSSRKFIEETYGKPSKSGGNGIINYWILYDHKGIGFTFDTKDIDNLNAKIANIVIYKQIQ